MDLSTIPEVYNDISEVSKLRALSLPPHRPYDCAIDLRITGIRISASLVLSRGSGVLFC